MEQQVEALAQKVVREAAKKPVDERLLVAIAGPPGSGKSTVVEPLLARVNQLLTGSGAGVGAASARDSSAPAPAPSDAPPNADPAICVSLDGWHMYRHELDAMQDPKDAHWRRGAAFTFDREKYLAFVKALRSPSTVPIPFFLFCHSTKDPEPSPSPVLPLPAHRVVIIEGLYTLLSHPGWIEAAEQMDVRVWIEVDREVARRRVLDRNFAAGIVGTREETAVRVDAVDMVNGEDVRSHRVEPTDVVYSIDDPSIK